MTLRFLPIALHRVFLRLCLCLCIALSIAMLACPAAPIAQAPDTTRAATIDAADARAADLFRALAEAKSDAAREQAISALHAMATSKSPEEHGAIGRYGVSALMTSPDAKKQAEFTEHRVILAKVIPLMFSTLTGDVKDKAWWVLINVQDASPPPKRALWEQWWHNEGKAKYEPAKSEAAASAPSRPAPAVAPRTAGKPVKK